MLSRDEGFGLPVLEAMAHGCPVISSRSSALPEVVGDAGVLVDAGDAREASNALASVMQDDELRESLVRRGRKRAAGMGWDAVSQQMVGVYDGVLRTV
ncbi:MAG: glycosyltransferase [Planctomycetota bacterium]|jgi:glycosyltransferase involved in cell wall biosynthesis